MKKIKFKLKFLAVLSTAVSSIAVVSCSNIVSYQWEKTDVYGTPIPKKAEDLHKYLVFEPNKEGIESTPAIVAVNSINNVDLNQKINSLLSFAKPKTEFIPVDFTYDVKAKINKQDPNSVDIVVTATSKKDGEKADIDFTLSGFKNNVVLDDKQKEIINNNILEVNGLRYLIDGFDLSKLNEIEQKNRTNAIRWSKSILSKYEEQVFQNHPLANFYYSSTFDNGIKRVPFENDYKLNAVIQINAATAKQIDLVIDNLKKEQEKLDVSKPVDKQKYDNAIAKIADLNALKVEINKDVTSVNKDTLQDDLTTAFNGITKTLNDKFQDNLKDVAKELATQLQKSLDDTKNFINKNINDKDKKAGLITLLNDTNTAIQQLNSDYDQTQALALLTDYYNKASKLYLQVLIERNFENALSVKNAEFNALKGATDLIYKKEIQVVKNKETDVIENEGYQDAPKVRTVVQKLVFLAQAYLIKDPTNSLYHSPVLKQVITDIMDDFAKNYYYKGQQQYVNWWFYEIGIPRDLTKLLGVLTKVYNDELHSTDKRDEYEQKFKNWSAGINYFLPNARYGGAAKTAILNYVPVVNKRLQTGANVIDTAKPIIAVGILTNNVNQVQDALLAMYDNLFREYVTSGDGFYHDGSFIQHGNIAYIGSYGEVLYTGIADIFKYFEGSVLDLSKDKRFERIYQFTELAVMPFMFKMSISDGLNGRSIVRTPYSDKQKGMNILGALTILVKEAPDEYKARLNNFILDQISSFTPDQLTKLGKKYKVRDLYIQNLIEFLSKPRLEEKPRTNEDWRFYETNYFDKNFEPSTISISSKGKPNVPIGIDLFKDDNNLWFTKNQNRYVWKQKDFMFTVNLRGAKVGFPEATLGENLESYYHADGSTLLHTSKNNEPYANDYWSVINAELIPGTTSIHTDQFNKIYNYNYPEYLGPNVANWTDEKAKKEYEQFIKALQDKRKRIEDNISLTVNKSFTNSIVFDNMGYIKTKLLNWSKSLVTRKAYFMIDNQIIIVGNAFSNVNANKITTIENRAPFDPSKASFTEDTVKINDKDAQRFIYNDLTTGETNGYFVFENKAVAQDRNEQKYAIISNSNRTLTKEKDRLVKTFKTLTIDQNNNEDFAYSIVPNYSQDKAADYLNVLNNFKILVNNHDYIVASYTKDVDGKKVTTYFISSFLEPTDVKQTPNVFGNSAKPEDQEYLEKFEKGIYVPGLDTTFNFKLPTTLVIQKEEGSNLWKGVSSSDTNERNYEIYLNKTFKNFKSKLVLNDKIDYANKENYEARYFRRNSEKVGISFFNNLGLENNIKHNTWFTMEESNENKT